MMTETTIMMMTMTSGCGGRGWCSTTADRRQGHRRRLTTSGSVVSGLDSVQSYFSSGSTQLTHSQRRSTVVNGIVRVQFWFKLGARFSFGSRLEFRSKVVNQSQHGSTEVKAQSTPWNTIVAR
ncbi:hypothetical protein HanIR_Chr09g0411821 [Helianthus annuus]|nr:hypothetical protein HanIR_Chr09g0411821 [Helianthus annuus]